MTRAVSWEALSHKAPHHQHNPTWAPSAAPHMLPTPSPTSPAGTTQDTPYNQWLKFHKLLLASGVSAARSRRWLVTGNRQHVPGFAAACSPEGTLVLLRSSKSSANRSKHGCHILLESWMQLHWHFPKDYQSQGWPNPSDGSLIHISLTSYFPWEPWNKTQTRARQASSLSSRTEYERKEHKVPEQQEWCRGIWILCSAHQNKKLDLTSLQLQPKPRNF